MARVPPLPMQPLPRRPLTVEQRAEMFSPQANIKAALRYIREKYSSPWKSWPGGQIWGASDWDWPGYDCDGMGV